MSVNGQDYRANVYLLDGTLQNDFTNGPAGSAAGTALGMDVDPRVPRRVERLQRGVRPQLRRADQRPHQVGDEHAARAAPSSSTATTRSTRATTSTSRASPISRATSSAASLGGPLARESPVLLRRLRRAARAAGQDDRELRARRQRAARASCPTVRSRSADAVRPYLAAIPRGERPVDRRRTRDAHVRLRPAPERELLPGTRRLPAPRAAHQFFARYTLRRCRRSGCRPTTRRFRARSSRPTSSSRPNTATSARSARCRRCGSATAARASDRTSKPTSTSAAAAVRRRPRPRRRHRHRRHAAVRSAELGESAAGAERLQRPVRRDPHARPPSVQGRRARGALSRLHDQPDVQPRDLHLRERPGLSREPGRRASSACRRRATSTATGRWTLYGVYAQDTLSADAAADAQRRTALRDHDDAGRHAGARLGARQPQRRGADGRPALSRTRRRANLSPRGGRRLGRLRRRLDVGARRLRPLLQHDQPAEPDRDRDQPAGDAAVRHRRIRRFPRPPFERGVGNTIRPMQWDLREPAAARVERQPAAGAAGGLHRDDRLRRLARHAPLSQHRRQHSRRRRSGATAGRSSPPGCRGQSQLRHDRAEEQRRRLVVSRAARRAAAQLARRALGCSRPTPGRAAEDTTQASTFFSDATNGTTVAFPEVRSRTTTRGRPTGTRRTTGC